MTIVSFYFFLPPFLVPFLVVPQGLRLPQPFPAKLLTSSRGRMVEDSFPDRGIVTANA